ISVPRCKLCLSSLHWFEPLRYIPAPTVPSKREPSEYTTALESSREAISLLCSSAAFPLSDLDRWNVMPAGSTSHLPFTVSTVEAGLIQSFSVLSSLTGEFRY